MSKWSPEVNHLAYVDGTILFTSADNKSMKIMIKVLKKYEAASGQLINLEKSVFYVHDKVAASTVSKIKRMTKIRKGTFPFTYLGCPIFYGKNKISYYDTMIKKIGKRVQS